MSRRAASFSRSLSVLPLSSLGHHCSRSLEELKSIFCRSNRRAASPPARSRHGEAGRGERVASCVYWGWRMIGEIEASNGGRKEEGISCSCATHSLLGSVDGAWYGMENAGRGSETDSSTCVAQVARIKTK